MGVGKEAGKLGIFAAIVAGMYWITKKLEGTWAGLLLLRGDKEDK